jgi:hypothetical protein
MRLLITTFFIVLLSAPVLALTPYTATYEAKGSGLKADNEVTLLPPDASGRIEFRSVSKARGISRVVKRDPITEYTRFEEIDGKLQPIEYHYLFNNSDSKRNASVFFDRKKLVATSLYKTETVELDIGPEHVDRLLEQLIFRTDIMAGSVADKYLVVDRNRLREAVYERLGSETIKTKAGTFDTVKYRRQAVGSSRSVIFWLARELEYLPVQMQHLKEDKVSATAVLTFYATGSSD